MGRARRLGALAVAFAAWAAAHGCKPKDRSLAGDGGLPDVDAGESVEPRPGMAWIPPGILIAGTPPEKLPRVADEEMPGEQVMMHGFYIDLFPYPNEPGAIPTTNMTQDEARALCEKDGKRLCTELELERACKGPNNTTYEYGDVYKPSMCQTGTTRALVPNGVNASCVSAFGVHDLHGGVWSFTSSAWRRDPSRSGLVAVRGGNGAQGELIGRCANGRGVKADARREDTGVRCCAGEPNTFEVVLSVTRGEPLKWEAPDDRVAGQLAALVPEDIQLATRDKPKSDRFKIERTWIWHPLGNEELVIGGGCAHTGPAPVRDGSDKSCGVVVTRMKFETPVLLGWASSDWWQPRVTESDSPRELFVHGGDRNGAFRRRLTYAWGRLAVGEKERKKKHVGETEPRYGE